MVACSFTDDRSIVDKPAILVWGKLLMKRFSLIDKLGNRFNSWWIKAMPCWYESLAF
jgi:hypothetical protein